MSLNTAHNDNGILIHAGEQILLYSQNVIAEFGGQNAPAFKGTKTGEMCLTTHRLIFRNSKKNDPMQSFSFPYVAISDLALEQPVFGANFIKGKVTAQQNGEFVGEAKFKLTFKSGGAIEFGQAMVRVQAFAKRNQPVGPPPPYMPPSGPSYPAPPPAYQADPAGYYGWQPPINVFPYPPPANYVYMVDTPPPYSGIFGPPSNPYAGATSPPPPDAKAAEAAQSAYFDPNKPEFAYVPPPAYYEHPPSYQQAVAKKDQ